MDTPVEFQGVFWLPRNSETKVPGTLRYIPGEGTTLQLLGTWYTTEELLGKKRIGDETFIVGMSEHGTLVTLWNCLRTGSDLHMPGISTMSFYANVLFVGAAITATEDLEFTLARARFSYLEDWVGLSGFDISENWEQHSVIVKYTLPDPLEILLPSSDVIRIVYTATTPSMRFVQNEATICQKVFIEYKPHEQKKMGECCSTLRRLQYFFGFAASIPLRIMELKLRSRVNCKVIDGKESFPFIDTYFVPVEPKNLPVSWSPNHALFKFSDIKEDLSGAIIRWLDKYELLQPVFDLYFGVQYDRETYVQQSFLHLVHAIEAYHRLASSDMEVTEEVHRRRMTAILSAVSQEHRSWLKEKLRYSNELTLRKRLSLIINDYMNYLSKLIPNHGSFITSVVDNRNYLTHYDSSLKSKALQGHNLASINVRLEGILQVILLAELGLSESIIVKAVEHKYEQSQSIATN